MNWFDWHPVVDRLEGRAQALTKGLPYTISLDTTIQTAACNIATKQIRLNPLAFNHKIRTMDDNLRARTNYLICRALLGHEVLHALYSDPNALSDDAVQRSVVNILEDARIEGIGKAESCVNRELFKFLSTICRQDQAPFEDFGITDKMSWLKILFLWRFGGSLPILPDPKNQKILDKMVTMAENALYATDSMQVAEIAKEVCRVTGMSQRAASKSEQSFPEQMDDLRESLEGQEEAKPNPRTKPEKQPTNEKPKRKSKSDKTPDYSQVSNDSDEAQQPEEQQSIPGDKPDSKSQSGNSGTENEVNDANSDEQSSREDDRIDASANDDSSDSNTIPCGESDSGDSKQASSCGAGAGSEVGDSGDDSDDEVSLEDLVGSLQSSISDGLDSATDALDNDDMTKVIEVKLPFENDVFNIKPAPYIDLLNEAKPLVHQIVNELRLPAPRASTAADKYSGRFKARYYVRNAEAPFARKKNIGIDVPPMALSLILDRSGSMINMITSLKLVAVSIARACDELNIPLDIWVLEGAAQIKTFEEHGPQVYARIAGIRAAGGTSVIPTLVSAQESLNSRPEALKQMLMITDGVPDSFDLTKELLSSAAFRDLFAMYVVPPLQDPELLQRYTDHGKECLSRLFDPRQFTVAPIDKIFSEWANFMKIYRSRYSTSLR